MCVVCNNDGRYKKSFPSSNKAIILSIMEPGKQPPKCLLAYLGFWFKMLRKQQLPVIRILLSMFVPWSFWRGGGSSPVKSQADASGGILFNQLSSKKLGFSFCLHEGNPGHHFQLSFNQEQEDMPLFRRTKEVSKYPQTPSRSKYSPFTQ